jgi:hypothetical protein
MSEGSNLHETDELGMFLARYISGMYKAGLSGGLEGSRTSLWSCALVCTKKL